MKRTLVLVAILTLLVPCGFAGAETLLTPNTPYVVGEWFLNNTSADTPPVTTQDTQFIFLNPSSHQEFNEYAFFDQDGNFCGCDRDVKTPNARIRYTMSDEAAGGQFACTGKVAGFPKATEGTMKSITFRVNSDLSIDFLGATQAGHQVHFFVKEQGVGGPNNTESDLIPVPVTHATSTEINHIHAACVDFCNQFGLCPALAQTSP
jgi:hypothetical protein